MTSFLKRYQIILASLVLCLFSLHLASTDRKGLGGAALVKGLLDLTVAPVQTAMLSTKDSFKEMWQRYVYLVGLKEENETLRTEIDSLVEPGLKNFLPSRKTPLSPPLQPGY
jgi:hypothetical protein